MIHFNYDTNIDGDEIFQDLHTRAAMYTKHLQAVIASGAYDADESSLNLAVDEELLADARALADTMAKDTLKYHIVIGIGGSNLGTKAVYDAVRGIGDVVVGDHVPKLLFADTTDPEWLAAAQALIRRLDSPDQVLISMISKSGGTTETVANFEIIMAALSAQFGDCRRRVVVITDEGSALWEQAGVQNIARLSIPKPVGGRYSVLSSVGIFPLLTVGIDVVALRDGAAAVRDTIGSDESPAVRSACALAYYYRQGGVMNDNFFFHPELESLGKWYRQLMGESIGKKESLDGEVVHTGITPTVSLGSTDLHSVGQLYLGGPKDKVTTFVHADKSTEVVVPQAAGRIFPELVPVIAGKSAATVMHAILAGVKAAYAKAALPYTEVALDAVDEQSIGAYMQFKMIEMMYLGQLLNVNSFDQPSVESYKIETKAILEAA